MRWIVVAGLAMLAAPVSAQESRVVQGCMAAIDAYAGGPPDQVHRVEDFQALTPPRARIAFNIGSRRSYATCEFVNKESPLELTEVCFEAACYSATDSAKRFEELKYLLEQAGF
ncbi:MAG: hypothetical protein K0R85_257 [Devosia sp.]|nr:hypothetical protein [Devosia sp.]